MDYPRDTKIYVVIPGIAFLEVIAGSYVRLDCESCIFRESQEMSKI